MEVLLVNACHVKHVAGRKSDVSDCEWLRELHSVGLLRGSCRPTAAIVTLRTYVRHRQTLIEAASTYVQRMQKALAQMNLQDQNLELFDACQSQITRCDAAIATQLKTLIADRPTPTVSSPPRVSAAQTRKNNDLAFDARPELFHLTGGVDLTHIDGMAPLSAVKLLAEIGTDMSR